jgi:hypothetical protein
MQTELARAISQGVVGMLGAEITHPDLSPRQREADLLVSQGRNAYFEGTVESITKRLNFFERALKRDPRSVRAYQGLAESHLFLAVFGETSQADERLALSEAAIRKGLEVGSGRAAPRADLAFLRCLLAKEMDTIECLFQEAIRFEPLYIFPRRLYARCCTYREDHQRALREIQTAVDHSGPGVVCKLWRPGSCTCAKFRRRIEITRVSRQAWRSARSPNRYLDQFCGWRPLDPGGREVQSNCLVDTVPRLLFRLAGRSAAWQLRAGRGVALSSRVVLQDHAEPDACSIRPVPFRALFRALTDCR